MSEASNVLETNKNVMSEGRADLIGKRFTFAQGEINVRLPDEGAFHSLNSDLKPIFTMHFDGKPVDHQADASRRKYSNCLEYNPGSKSDVPFTRNEDPAKTAVTRDTCQHEDAEDNIRQHAVPLFFVIRPQAQQVSAVKLRVEDLSR